MAKFIKSLGMFLGEVLKDNKEKEHTVSDLERGTKLTRSMGEDLRLSENGTAQKDLRTRCIYRVPDRLRKVNPEAYVPQMLDNGLLQPRYYLSLPWGDDDQKQTKRTKRHLWWDKVHCLEKFKGIYGDEHVKEFEKIIKREMELIKESYDQISDSYKELKLINDSVFILLFFMLTGSTLNFSKKEDILSKLPSTLQENATTIKEDLILLENQLPYALLEELFEPFFSTLNTTETFRDITLRTFGLEGKIKKEVRFLHFTDLLWRVRVSTLPLTEEQNESSIAETEPPKSRKIVYNAEKLYSAGVDFVNVDEGNDLSLVISFKDGILKLPCFTVKENTEKELRNLMALEQCHYPRTTYVCDYISFLDFLIKTDQDVDLLVTKGIVRNWLGDHRSVTAMLKRLCLGLEDSRSQYYDDAAERLNNYYENPLNRTVGTLLRVYFKDIWTGTGTVAAIVLLVLTFIQTVASIVK